MGRSHQAPKLETEAPSVSPLTSQPRLPWLPVIPISGVSHDGDVSFGTPTLILLEIRASWLSSTSLHQPLPHFTSRLCSSCPFSTYLPDYCPRIQIWSWRSLLKKHSSHCSPTPTPSTDSPHPPPRSPPHSVPVLKLIASQGASISLHLCPQLLFRPGEIT